MGAIVERTGPDTAPPSQRRVGFVAAAALLAVGMGVLIAPFPSSVGDAATGDPQLAARLAELAGTGRVGITAAVVTANGTRLASVGEDGNGGPLTADTPMEVGSITKTFTGTVLADLARRGVVRPGERVRDLVPDRPWRAGGAGDVTLEELTSHRSGLPRLPVSAGTLLGSFGYELFGLRPYDSDRDTVLAAADAASLTGRGTSAYSNLGTALLGHALAARTGATYPELLRSSVTAPLGMDATVAPAAVPSGAAAGHDATGRRVQDWVDPGDAPSGAGVYSTGTDMAAYARAVLEGRQPYADATVPRWAGEGGREVGYAWNTRERDGRTFLWHNGSAGGMTSSIVVDRDRGEAVVVLGNTSEEVDGVAFALAGMSSPSRSALSSALGSPVGTAFGIVFPLLAGVSLLAAARGGWRRAGPARRTSVVAAAGGTLFLFAAAVAFGATTWLIAPFWLAGWALAGAGVAIAAQRWGSMQGPDGALRWTGAGAGFVIGLGALAAVGGALV